MNEQKIPIIDDVNTGLNNISNAVDEKDDEEMKDILQSARVLLKTLMNGQLVVPFAKFSIKDTPYIFGDCIKLVNAVIADVGTETGGSMEVLCNNLWCVEDGDDDTLTTMLLVIGAEYMEHAHVRNTNDRLATIIRYITNTIPGIAVI